MYAPVIAMENSQEEGNEGTPSLIGHPEIAFVAAWAHGAGSNGDQVEGQDQGAPAQGSALQLEEDRQDCYQVSQEKRNQRR